jgi:hypothetical protein
LNRCCSFDARLESMLLGDPTQNPFSTVSTQGGHSATRLIWIKAKVAEFLYFLK